MCDTIRFVLSKTTSVHSKERTGRQGEGWWANWYLLCESPESLLHGQSLPFQHQPPSHRRPQAQRGARRGPHRLARIVWAQGRAKPFKWCCKVVARLTSTLLAFQEDSNSGLAILVAMVAQYMWFVVLRKGSPFFPKVMQFKVTLKGRKCLKKKVQGLGGGG